MKEITRPAKSPRAVQGYRVSSCGGDFLCVVDGGEGGELEQDVRSLPAPPLVLRRWSIFVCNTHSALVALLRPLIF